MFAFPMAEIILLEVETPSARTFLEVLRCRVCEFVPKILELLANEAVFTALWPLEKLEDVLTHSRCVMLKVDSAESRFDAPRNA